VPPSPKFQDHEVGLPADVSVNCTDWPATGDVGLYVNAETMTGIVATLSVLLPCLDPERVEATNVTT
jgi:hypothetical protein